MGPPVVKKNLDHFLGKMLDIVDYFDTLPPDTRGARRFTLLPKKDKLTPGFFFIDPTSLPELLKKLDETTQIAIIDAMVASLNNGPPPPVAQDQVLRLQSLLTERRTAETKFYCEDQQDRPLTQLLWRTLVNVAKYETATRKFALKVSTNAYAVSIFLQKLKPANSPASDEFSDLDNARVKYANGDFDLIMGLDPGRSYPVSAFRGEVDIVVDANGNGKPRSFCPQLSTKEWRHDAKITEHQQWEVRMRRKHQAYGAAIAALPSLKVGNFETFTENLRLTLAQAPFLLQHRTMPQSASTGSTGSRSPGSPRRL
jgi:hypothetical protein